MMGLPNWLRGKEDDLDMTREDVPKLVKNDEMFPAFVPPIATIKKALPFHITPETPTVEQEAAVVAQAHSYIEQWKLKDIAQQKTIEELETSLKQEQRKSGLLELDVAQHVNTIATLQSEILALKAREEKYRTFLAVKKQINEKERQTYIQFEIEDPPKKERKNVKATKASKKESTDRKEADKSTPEDRPIAKEYHGA